MRTKEFDINAMIGGNRSQIANIQLKDDELSDDPFTAFEVWLREALKKDPQFANAMTLSTCGKDGITDSRVVLLRNISYGGLTFYTNYQSKKGKDISENSKASVLFFWREQFRQVRIQGEVRFLPLGESERYFASRPFQNQVGAWVSMQSRVIESRKVMDEAFARESKKYEGQKVPKPEYWGGYVLLPRVFEFWQGRTDRLHDRIRYTWVGRDKEKEWLIERLMP